MPVPDPGSNPELDPTLILTPTRLQVVFVRLVLAATMDEYLGLQVGGEGQGRGRVDWG